MVLFLYQIKSLKTQLFSQPYAVRVTVESQSANQDYPLLFVARLQRGVVSWPIPVEGWEKKTNNLQTLVICWNRSQKKLVWFDKNAPPPKKKKNSRKVNWHQTKYVLKNCFCCFLKFFWAEISTVSLNRTSEI